MNPELELLKAVGSIIGCVIFSISVHIQAFIGLHEVMHTEIRTVFGISGQYASRSSWIGMALGLILIAPTFLLSPNPGN